MFIDLNKSENKGLNLELFDVAIIGAGAAGITIAMQLAKKNLK